MAEDDWHWDLNPGTASMRSLFGTTRLQKNHGLQFLFLRYGTVDWAEGEGRTVCICGYSKVWNLSEDIKSLLLSLYTL